MKFLKNTLAFVFFLSLAFSFMSTPLSVSADNTKVDLFPNKEEVGNKMGGFTEKDPRLIVADIINVVLGFLGIVAICLILFAGFKWMTAGGNEDKVTEAKKLLANATIGLVIILAAFALATFVLNAIQTSIG